MIRGWEDKILTSLFLKDKLHMESLLNFQSNYSKKIAIRSTMELSNMNGDFL